MRNGALSAGLLGGVIGALLGGGAVSAMRPPAMAGSVADSAALSAALADAMRPVVAELRTARPSTDTHTPGRQRVARGPAATEPEEGAREPLAGGTRPMPTVSVPEPVEPLRPERSTWLPEPRFERLRDLHGFEDDVRVRQRWLFLTEKEALATFGTPGLVWGDGSSEKWEYEMPYVDEDGDPDTRTHTLIFHRGRLVQFFD
jgi:hypothetical protein